jgi:four helix bundle protein
VPLAHEKLVAWQRADDLFISIHRLTRNFPIDERWALTSQVRRAAYSVAANIVEGMARRSTRDRLRFLNIAEASLAEVAYCLHVARRLEYLDGPAYVVWQRTLAQVGAPLVGLIRSMKQLPVGE